MEGEKAKQTAPTESVRVSRRSIDPILRLVVRSDQRSSLFWWLFEHHDELREAEAESGLGIPWRRLCGEFVTLGLTVAGGGPITRENAAQTWQRVRKAKKRAEERRAEELAERQLRRAADPRRNMPSRFPKGDYGPALVTQPQGPPAGSRALALTKGRLTRDEQRDRGLQLSTAEGVVVTKVSRVYKLANAVADFEFEESGMIRGGVGWSGALESKQLMNTRSGRHINDRTEHMYAKLGLEVEQL